MSATKPITDEINRDGETTLSLEVTSVESDQPTFIVAPKKRNYFECEHCKKSFRKSRHQLFAEQTSEMQL